MTTLDTPDATTPLPGDLDLLRRTVRGAVHTRDEPEWLAHSMAWNRLVQHQPALVVVAAEPADVASAARFAHEHDLGLGVQCTGHGMVRPVDGVLVDVAGLDTVVVDPGSRTAVVGAGCTWAPVLAAAQEHGLAPLLGSSSGVGAVGYTLGGGLGWLARAHGAASDHVVRFEVVAPDGRLLVADAEENPSLFDALRGGGGGTFGIVTAMTIRLVPVTTVYGGDLLYPTEMAGEVVEAWSAWAESSPTELTSSIVFMNFPPLPEVPEPVRGRSFTIVRSCWSGPVGEGPAVVDRLRSVLPPLVDTMRVLPFTEVDTISNDPTEPMPAVATGGWLTRADEQVGRTLAAATFPAGGPPALIFSEIRHVGSPAWRNGGGVIGNRDHSFLFHSVGVPMVHRPDEIVAMHDTLKGELGDALATGRYLNFVDHEERRDRSGDGVRADAREHLAELRRSLDPDGSMRYGVDHG